MRDIVREHLSLKATGNDPENLFGEKVRASEVIIYHRISLENKTNVLTELRLGIESGGILHAYEEEDDPAAATLYWTDKLLFAGEGERFQAQIKGATAADVIKVFLTGIRYDLETFRRGEILNA